MKTRRLVGLALAVALLAGAFAGCKPSDNTSSKTPIASNTSGSSGMSELSNNTLKLTVGRPQFNEPAEGKPVQNMWNEMMAEYLGCTLDITWEESLFADYNTNQTTKMASGQFPDVLAFSAQNKDLPNQYGYKGMLADINQYKDFYTYYNKFIEGTPGKEEGVFNDDGTMFAFYDGYVNENNVQGAQSFTGFAYRFDLLKKNNLEPATTLDEYTALAKKLKELYPDAYPISNSTKDYAFYRGFVGIFHTWDTLYWNGTEWKYGPEEDTFREMIVYLNGLYKDGLIDPEFVTDTSDMATAKALNGKILTIPTLWAGSVSGWNASNEKSDPSMEWGLAYLPSKDGKMVSWKWGSKLPGYTLSKNFGIMINKNAKNIDWIVKMIDYQYSDELIDAMNWGVKGDTYDIVNGKKDYTEKVYSQEKPSLYLGQYGSTSLAYARCGIVFAPQVFEPIPYTSDKEPWWDPSEKTSDNPSGYVEGQYWINSDKYGGEDSVSPFDRAPFYTLDADESQKRASAITAYETISKEWAANFIAGVKDPSNDSDWNDYLNALKSAGVDMEGTIKMLNEKCK